MDTLYEDIYGKDNEENTLSDKDIQKIKESPIIQSFVSKSKDGKYFIHRTIITDIKSVKYYQAVLNNANTETKR